jgi:peptidyl-prolyl cis-trans isomerase A (cyclophilin A)
MARTSNPDSATSQFFLNVADNAFLDPGSDAGYAVFGKIVRGMDVVDIIANSQTTTKQSMQNVPINPVFIKSAERV